MADMQLLQYARSRDDAPFVWRVAAAMTIIAQYKLGAAPPDMTVEAHKLMDWVLDHPLESSPIMLSFVATDQTVAAAVIVDEHGVVDTSEVPDDAIKNAVDSKWDIVAIRLFPPA